MDFTDDGSFNKALALNGAELGGNYLTVEEAKPRGDFNDSGRGRGDRGNSAGRGNGRSGRGRFGGRGAGRGGRSSFNKPSLTASGTGLEPSSFC